MSTVGSMILSAAMCTKCGAGYGKCGCWTRCACGWSYETGGKCRNTVHNDGDGTLQVVAMNTARKRKSK